MDESRYAIRRFRPADYASAVELRRQTDPDLPRSEDEMRYADSARRSSRFALLRWLATDGTSGRVVGMGELAHDPFDFDPKKFEISVRVAPEHRGAGVGTALYDRLLATAARRNATGLRTSVREGEPASLAFAVHRGFAERSRGLQCVLDVDGTNLAGAEGRERSLRGDGFTFTTLAEEGLGDPRVAERVRQLEAAATEDLPRSEPYNPLDEDEYRALVIDDPFRLPDAWFLAKDGPVYAAMSSAARAPAQPDTLVQLLTCTRPEYRGRGLATALKARVVRYARARGYRWIRTFNDATNEAIVAVNRSLGFRRVETWLELDKPLRKESRARRG